MLLLGCEANTRWDVGGRLSRTISVSTDNEVLISNLFALSTGQTVLLDLFLTILRHADLSGQPINELSDIKGLVVVDEIDLHLHTNLQFAMLPNLLHLFPGVQFILSSHSPLFLLGMEEKYGEDGVTIMDMPSGDTILAERFCEFKTAFDFMAQTREFETEIRKKVSDTQQPLLFVEGSTDIQYIRKAAELLGRDNVLSGIDILEEGGSSGLDKIWKNFHHDRWSNVHQPVVLMYDCDVKSKNDQIGKVYRRTIPRQENSMIKKGIENLFPTASIEKAQGHKAAFIYHRPVFTQMIRG